MGYQSGTVSFGKQARYLHTLPRATLLKLVRATTTGMSLVFSISVETNLSPTQQLDLAPAPHRNPPEEAPPSLALGRLLVISILAAMR